MKRLFIVLIKYIPIIQMVGMLFNNILYCFSNIYIISYLLDFIIGNSITTTFLLYVCSMVERKVIVDKVSTFVGEKLNEVLDNNPFSFIIKPYISRVANNYIGKLDGLLKAIEDKDGKVDIEGILSESIDNLVVAQVKKYPNVFSGIEIGNGTIKINIPSFDKQLVFDYNDIESFKQNLLN